MSNREILELLFFAKPLKTDPLVRWTEYELPHSKTIITVWHTKGAWSSPEKSGNSNALFSYCYSLEMTAIKAAAKENYRAKCDSRYLKWINRFNALGEYAIANGAISYRLYPLDDSEFPSIILFLNDINTQWEEGFLRFRNDGCLRVGYLGGHGFTNFQAFRKIIKSCYPNFKEENNGIRSKS